MKQLLITLEYPPHVGGIATYIRNFLSYAKDADFVVYAPKIKGDTEYDAGQPWKTYRKSPLFSFFWPRWLKMYWQVKAICKREKIQSLLVHHVLPVGYIGILIKKFLKIDFTLFLHGTDVHTVKKSKWKQKMFTKVCMQAKTVVVNSEYLKEQVEMIVGQLNSIQVVYPCASEAFFEQLPSSELNSLKAGLALTGKRVVLTVARMVEGKGYPFMIREMKQVMETLGNVIWIVIGDGPKRSLFVKLLAENNMQSSVRYLGVVPPEKLPAYYQLANLFLLLTHSDEASKEAWGTVFMEAAASGLPVVAGKVGGVAEAVENGVTGILVDTYQEKAVAATIVDMLKNESFRKTLGENAKNRVETEFTWEKQISKLAL